MYGGWSGGYHESLLRQIYDKGVRRSQKVLLVVKQIPDVNPIRKWILAINHL